MSASIAAVRMLRRCVLELLRRHVCRCCEWLVRLTMLRAAVCERRGCCDVGCGREFSTAIDATVAAAEVEAPAEYEAAGSASASPAADVLAAGLAGCAAPGSLLSSAGSGAAEWSAAAVLHAAAGPGGAVAADAAVCEAVELLRRRSTRRQAEMRVRNWAAALCCGGRAAVGGASATCDGVLQRSLPQAGKESRLQRLLALELLDAGRWG